MGSSASGKPTDCNPVIAGSIPALPSKKIKSEVSMVFEIKELLESLVEEILLDEDNADAIIHEYADRIVCLLDESPVFYPEDMEFID